MFRQQLSHRQGNLGLELLGLVNSFIIQNWIKVLKEEDLTIVHFVKKSAIDYFVQLEYWGLEIAEFWENIEIYWEDFIL
uniref:Uncharacterized protein n=1 Tax=Rhizophagus irregularis (strain DAOM 181602 / DAOM 197198 / MUCL 43194) TaxID=747089 RepID=U9TIB8_RHIID